jgi:hypothetical protein
MFLFFTELFGCASVDGPELPVKVRQISEPDTVTDFRNAVLFLLEQLARLCNAVFG